MGMSCVVTARAECHVVSDETLLSQGRMVRYGVDSQYCTVKDRVHYLGICMGATSLQSAPSAHLSGSPTKHKGV